MDHQQVVETRNVDVAGFAPGVTDAGVKAKAVLLGKPVTERVMAFENGTLFCGVIVTV